MKPRAILATLAVVTAIATPALAQAPATAGGEYRQEIDIDVEDADLREVMQEIGRRVGKNILVAPNIQERVSINLRNIGWLDAVSLIAKVTRCEVDQSTPDVILLTQPPRVTIQFTDAKVRVVLTLLAAYAGKNIIIAPEVTGTVTLDLKDVHWLTALESIVKTTGRYVVVEDTPDLLRVVPSEAITDQLETVRIPLRYVRPPVRYRAVPPQNGTNAQSNVGSLFTGQPSQANPDDFEGSFSLFRALKDIIEKTPIENDTISYDLQTNSLFVTATRPTLQEIREIISLVDKEPAQVYVEIKFISTATNNFDERGIKFGGDSDSLGLGVSGPFPTGLAVSSGRFFEKDVVFGATQFQVLPGQVRQIEPQPVGNLPFNFGDKSGFTSGFFLPGVIDATGLNATLNLISSVRDTRVLQQPSLFMLDNQEAVIFVGENVPYAEFRTTNDINGNVQVNITAGQQSPVNVGFSLYVSPHVVPEQDKIMLTVIPRVNELTGTSSGNAGFDRFAFNNNAFIDLPRTREQAIVTQMMVQDGQTAVIGGLLTETDIESEKRVPILSEIPILGNLFTNKTKTKEARNLIIFITPTIVRSTRDSRSLFRRLDQRRLEYDWIYQRRNDPGAAGLPAEEGDDVPEAVPAGDAEDMDEAAGPEPVVPDQE